MDSVIRIIEILAWPVVVLVLTYSLRSELRQLLERLTEVKYGTFAAKFGRELEEARVELRQIEATVDSATSAGPGSTSSSFNSGYADTLATLLKIADIAPRAAIVEAWRRVEAAARKTADRMGITMIGGVGESQAIHTLADNGSLPASAISLYERLRKMRNDAAHTRGDSITKEVAEDYILLALHFAEQVDRIERSSRGG